MMAQIILLSVLGCHQPTSPAGTPSTPYLLPPDGTLNGEESEWFTGTLLYTGRFGDGADRVLAAGCGPTDTPRPNGTLEGDGILGIVGAPYTLHHETPGTPDTMLFPQNGGLSLAEWPFVDGSFIANEAFAPNLYPSFADALDWGHPGGLLTTQGNRLLLHEVDGDSVISTTELTTESQVTGIDPQSLSLSDGLVVHAAGSDGVSGTLLLDTTTTQTLAVLPGLSPLAVGDLGGSGTRGLLVEEVTPGRSGDWILSFLHDLSVEPTSSDRLFSVTLPSKPQLSSVGATSAVVIADFDGDGHDDLALGYPAARSDGLPHPDRRGEGRVLIYRGPLEPGDYGPEQADLVLLVDDPAVEDFGEALLAADTDEDGIPELLVGAPGTDDRRGAAYRFDDVMRPWRELNGID